MPTDATLPPKPPPTIPANQTLYVSNLTDKLQKQDLRRELYILFSTYGSVLDVVALKTLKMRGQAHITFKDIATATRAMRDLQGFEFFGKEMKVQYAKSKSNTLAMLDGTFNLPKAAPEPAAENKPTSLQQSIFNAPNPSAAAAPPGLPLKPATTLKPDVSEMAQPKSPQGVKRPRDEEDEDEGGEAPMEEDEDDMQMDESDDE